MESITFKGVEYPLRSIFIPGFGERYVGTESLENALIPGEGYADGAKGIDEIIFFYVPDSMIKDLEMKLTAYVSKEVGAEE